MWISIDHYNLGRPVLLHERLFELTPWPLLLNGVVVVRIYIDKLQSIGTFSSPLYGILFYG